MKKPYMVILIKLSSIVPKVLEAKKSEITDPNRTVSPPKWSTVECPPQACFIR